MAVPYYYSIITIYEERQVRKIQRKRIRDLCDPFNLGDREFQSLWLITKPMALYIVERFHSALEPKTNEGLPAHLKKLKLVYVHCLRYYATYNLWLMESTRGKLDKTTVCARPKPLSLASFWTPYIQGSLLNRFIFLAQKRNAELWLHVLKKYSMYLYGILGLIDWTHIQIFPPPGPQGAQYNNKRKDAHTINVQLIADADCRILSVNARYPGRVHDAFIWHHSMVKFI